MIKALFFDLNGTVIDIRTDESGPDVYRTLSNLLDYQGVRLSPDEFRDAFWERNKKQRKSSPEFYPEFDAVGIFESILLDYGTEFTRRLPKTIQKTLPLLLAQAFRAATRFQLQLYPGVTDILDMLGERYLLAAVSDGQSAWAIPELNSVGLSAYFKEVVVSSDLGYRKPDPRIFRIVLDKLNLTPEEVLFIGNDMYRDVCGAKRVGMKTIFFQSNQGDRKPRDEEPDYIIYDFRQLPEAVRFLDANQTGSPSE